MDHHGKGRNVITLTDLAFGSGKAESEVGGHVEPRQHEALVFVVIEGQVDLCHICRVHCVGW